MKCFSLIPPESAWVQDGRRLCRTRGSLRRHKCVTVTRRAIPHFFPPFPSNSLVGQLFLIRNLRGLIRLLPRLHTTTHRVYPFAILSNFELVKNVEEDGTVRWGLTSRILAATTRLARVQAVEEEHQKVVEQLQELLKDEQNRLLALKTDLQRFQVTDVPSHVTPA